MSLKRLKVIGIILPVLFLVVMDVIRHKFWFHSLHTWQALLFSGIAFTAIAVGFALVIFDHIESLVAANARLQVKSQEALSFLEDLVHHSADAVIVSSADGLITLWNEGAETIYGFSRAEAVGRPPIMVPPERHDDIRETLSRVMRGEVVRNFETQRLHKEGHLVDVILTVTPVRNAQGEVVAALDISKDVTWEKRVERQTQQLALLMDRDRICMDLHDSVIQSIYAVGLQLEGCVEGIDEEPQVVRDHLERAIDALHAINQDIRSYILDLRPKRYTEADLADEMANVLDRLKGQSKISRRLKVSADVRNLDRDQVDHFLQITREALSNVDRHAQATTVDVTVDASAEGVRLAIRDNGQGWDPSQPQDFQQMGLRNMAIRAQAAGGALQIESRPGAGTTLEVTIPRRAKN